MDKSKHLLMDDTNQLTVEDVEVFEASLDPATIADIKAETKSIFDSYHARCKTRGETAV